MECEGYFDYLERELRNVVKKITQLFNQEISSHFNEEHPKIYGRFVGDLSWLESS